MNDWKENKIFFLNIIEKGYFIKKDINTNNVLYINWDEFVMKCKYFIAFSVDEQKNILWSCDNPFTDQKTKYLSQNIKTYLNNEKIFSSLIINKIKKLLHEGINIIYEEDNINIIWCIVGNYKKYKQFYILTEIVYF